jgi:hypothetical protein
MTLLGALHDRGIVNEDALEEVLKALIDGQPLTRDHLIQIFGVAPVYRLLTTRDETMRQLVREALDLLTNPDTSVDLRDWAKAAGHVIGPVASIARNSEAS